MSNEDWTEKQADEFRSTIAVIDPPRDLEPRVIAAMKESGLIRTAEARRRRYLAPLAAAAAAAVVAFIAGFAVADRNASPAVTSAPGEQFVLLLRESDTSAPESPEAIERLVDEYRSWAIRLHEEGKLIGGEKLDTGGVVLEPGARGTVARPWSRDESFLGGYFVVNAVSYDEAARIAASCPHLKYGGTIEVRKIEPT